MNIIQLIYIIIHAGIFLYFFVMFVKNVKIIFKRGKEVK